MSAAILDIAARSRYLSDLRYYRKDVQFRRFAINRGPWNDGATHPDYSPFSGLTPSSRPERPQGIDGVKIPDPFKVAAAIEAIQSGRTSGVTFGNRIAKGKPVSLRMG